MPSALKTRFYCWLDWSVARLPAAAAGALAGLAMPGIGRGVWLLPALVSLFFLVRRRDWGAFGDGWTFGFAFFLVSIPWIHFVVHVFGGVPELLAWGPLLLLAAYLALFAGLVQWTTAAAPERWRWCVWPLAWVCFEASRGWWLGGFPWNPLHIVFAQAGEFAAAGRIVGGPGLSALLAWLAAAAVESWSRRRLRPVAVVLLAAGVVTAWGYAVRPVSGAPIDAVVVQGNIEQELKWTPDMGRKTLMIYEDLTRQTLVDGKSDLIVWPETAIPYYFEQDGAHQSWLRNINTQMQAPIIFGAPAFRNQDGRRALFNRAYVAVDGKLIDHYDKSHLVPFGEYVPLERLFFFVDKMVTGIGNFQPGGGRHPVSTGMLDAGVFICYESVYPGEVREFVAAGSEVLVQLTNDGWFGPTAAPHQHLAMSRLRALENGVPLLRAANTGISAIVRADGQMIAEAAYGTRKSLRAEVPRGAPTPYARYGWIWTWLWRLGAFAFLVWGFLGCNARRARRAGVHSRVASTLAAYAAHNRETTCSIKATD